MKLVLASDNAHKLTEFRELFRSLNAELLSKKETGFTAEVDTGRKGPTLLIMGELDSIICPSHPECDPETGAVHSCGHNAQCAGLLGVAAALTEDGILDDLSGKIRLCAVPAEELLEIDYRLQLRKEGKIKYMGGKPEFPTKEAYFAYMDALNASGERIRTLGEDTLAVKI